MTDRPTTLSLGLQFLRTRLLAILSISALLIIPCFWHRRLEAGDLPSHTYNAWLAQLIEQGKAPGLYTVWQRTNVLFDFLLLYSSKLFGFVFGPKLAAAICVLIFFWGVFSFVTAASGYAPWSLTPLIAMLTYGYTFNMGFFNYYLSIGLACFALAFFWNARNWDWLAAALFLGLAGFAHPLGLLWCLATLAYVSLRKKVPTLWGFAIPIAVIAFFAAAHWYLLHSTILEINWRERPFYFWNGTDQLVLYSFRGRWIASACVVILGAWFANELLEWRQYLPNRKRFALLVELYLLSFCVLCLLPQDIRPDSYSAWLGFLVSRLSVVPAIFALCLFSSLKPRKFASVALAACAAVFFLFLYQDTAVINRLESNAEILVAKLPYGTRIIPTIIAAHNSRISFVGHVMDRACIGHCFTYSNYEPPSGQFRVRVRERSPVVGSSEDDNQEMEAGNYVVQAADPPLVNIYQCAPNDFTVLCVRNLAVGEATGPPEPGSEN